MTTVIDLRDALIAARPVLFGEAMDAADALLAALVPPMEEPTWPGYVMAVCPYDDREASLHSLRIGTNWWECSANCSGAGWSELGNPRPLTAEERAKYGIPSECYKPHAGPITNDLVERAAEAFWNALGPNKPWSEVQGIRKSHYQNYARAALAAALREAGE